MAWEFNRHVEEGLIKALKEQRLWKEKLEADCKKGDVFLAIRKDYLSFYHKGGSLFKFEKNIFSTHVKYALVIDTDDENAPKDSIVEDSLKKKNLPLISDFINGYAGIKKNCELFSGVEAKGVSKLYHKDSYLHSESIFVLDIEIAFKKDDKKQDRIDILLYDNNSQTLRFIEAKHFSNNDLFSKTTPKVIEQIKKYEGQIGQRGKKLIKEYGLYIDGLNQIFNTQYKQPEIVDPKVSLLIFGFDDAQANDDRFKKMREVFKAHKILCYCIGKPKGLKANNVWKGN